MNDEAKTIERLAEHIKEVNDITLILARNSIEVDFKFLDHREYGSDASRQIISATIRKRMKKI